MDLFRKQARVPLFGSGRRLRSERILTDCLANLEASIFSYRPPESAYRSAYVFPGWRWYGPPEKSPETVISFIDSNDDFLLAAFWSDRSGTECVLFPLGSGDERLASLPIIDHSHHRDPSLRFLGVIPGGQIALAPPHVSAQFFAEILNIAGFPSTPYNLETLGMKIGEMFLIKALEFISSYDSQSADTFIQSHRYHDGPSQQFCQRILDDLAAWNPDVLPYIQDMPMRCKAIVLKLPDAPIWNELERAPQSPTLMSGRLPESLDAWVERGMDHFENGRSAEALAAYDRALVLDSDFLDAWKSKGIILRKLGRYQEALTAYDRILALNPNDAQAWNNKGNVLSDLGRFEEALAHSEQAVALAPHNAGCWYCKGCTLDDLGRHQEALVAYDRALELNPGYIDAWNNKGIALRVLAQYEEALVAFDRALALAPNSIDALVNKGSTMAEMERYEEALANYDRVLALDPDCIDAWFNKANVFNARTLYEEALAAYGRTRALAPDHTEAWNNEDSMLARLGHYEEALATFNHVLALDPYHANAWNNKGVMLRILGNLQEAEFAQQRARAGRIGAISSLANSPISAKERRQFLPLA